MLQVAVIGTGHVGNQHCQHYADHPKANLVAVCDVVHEKAAATAGKFGARAYSSVGAMLAQEKLDAVSVCTAGVENGGDHFEPVMASIAAGIATLCEKPISNDIVQARAMVANARARNVPLGINLNHRFTPAALRLKRLQTEGELGEVLFINMALWINNSNDSSPWFHIRALHPHSIDVMRYFGGPISRVQCFMHKGPGRATWSNLSMNVQFASGALGHLTGSYDASMLHPIERCEVGGSQGRAVIENVYERLEFLPRNSREKMVIENGIMGGLGSFGDLFKNRIARFVEQVEAREPLDASGEEGLAAQEIIEAAIRSHECGTVESVAG